MTRSLIARADERRAAGDRAGACETVGIYPDGPVPEFLVPDLLRWHAVQMHAAAAGGRVQLPVWLHSDGSAVVLDAPVLHRRPYHFRLTTVPAGGYDERLGLHATPELWDARHTGELLARCGGVTRLPFFAADGRRLGTDELGGDSPEGHAERIQLDLDAGRWEPAWDAAGIDVDGVPLQGLKPGLAMLSGHARAHAERLGVDTLRLGLRATPAVLDRLDTARPRLRNDASGGPVPVLPAALLDRPACYERLFRPYDVQPWQLHPLAAAALFPALPRPGNPDPALWPPREPTAVPCGGGIHDLHMRDGVLDSLQHTPGDLERELTLHALGGRRPTGCAQHYLAWRTGGGLPAHLSLIRSGAFFVAQEGDADALAGLLDAGLDPRCREHNGRTLLHTLPYLLPRSAQLPMLHRLVAAGLDWSAAEVLRRPSLTPAERAAAAPELLAAFGLAG